LIELRTFGALDLRGSDDREVRAVLAQPKRLALLAYLAAAGDGSSGPAFHRRDKLIALFWPDQDATRARAALSRAVHYLRASLGEGVLISRADEELGLDFDRISCDAPRFRDDLAKNRLTEALELYRGDFMAGFFLSDVPEFDRWIEAERRQFRDSAAGAARKLSQSAESRGDLALALHWARQATSYAPFDEADVRRVLLLLARSGERANASDFFDRFARRMREELELDPSPETVGLMEAITSGRYEAPSAPAEIAPPVRGSQDNARAAPAAPGVAPERAKSGRRVAAFAALLLFVLGAPLVWNAFRGAATADKPPSIAVLPLANLNADTSSQYFSDGMTEELIATLSQIDGLRVAGRTSSFAYKNRNVPVTEIARALNVDAVLEGSARHDGNRVRITLQLVRAPEGFSLWSKAYEGELHNVFALQQDISRDVAGALKVRLVPGNERVSGRTTDPETYDLYLWGRYHWNSRTPDGLLRAAEFFQRAIARDSSYAPAYTGLADSYNLLVIYDRPPREIMPKAKAAAMRALELDETQSEAHAARAYVAMWYEWDWTTAEQHFRRALELNPSNATAHHWYSIYLEATGRLEQSLREMDSARELEPASLFLRGAAGVRLFLARDYPRAVQQLEATLKMGPKATPTLPWLGMAYLKVGRVQDAISALERATADGDNRPAVIGALAISYAAAGRDSDARSLVRALEARASREFFARTWLARMHMALGDKDRALTWLERAYEERDGWLTHANVEPTFDDLRDEPRFRAILTKMGLR
jgi:TolB-like protein/DNA-binding SARP family transcriptional activator/Tfp pilus assembly protein PilF